MKQRQKVLVTNDLILATLRFTCKVKNEYPLSTTIEQIIKDLYPHFKYPRSFPHSLQVCYKDREDNGSPVISTEHQSLWNISGITLLQYLKRYLKIATSGSI